MPIKNGLFFCKKGSKITNMSEKTTKSAKPGYPKGKPRKTPEQMTDKTPSKGAKSTLVKNASKTVERVDFEGDEKFDKAFAKAILPENLQHFDQLNAKEYKFLAIYCSNGFNAQEAARLAGYKKTSRAEYRAVGYGLLTRPYVVEAIRLYINTIIQPYRDRLELEILDMYYKRATFEVSTFYNKNGKVKAIDKIPLEWQCCVDKVVQKRYGKNGEDFYIEYELPNRDLALQALYRFVTGVDVTQSAMLPDEAKRKMQAIFTASTKKVKISTKTVDKQTAYTGNNDE